MNGDLSILPALFAVAFLLFFLEIFLPGGLLAVIGSVLLGIASVVVGVHFGTLAGAVTLLLCVVLAAIFFFWEVRFLSSGLLAKYFTHTHANNVASNELVGTENLIGREGEAATRMSPSGRVLVDGQLYEAMSNDGLLEAGTSVQVTQRDSFKLVVRKIQNSH